VKKRGADPVADSSAFAPDLDTHHDEKYGTA
jgi:hypothetical protein